MYRQSFFRMGVIGMSAISGIEQALWDIRGKALGVPVYQLLGGAVRDKVRMYTHLGGGDMKAVYETQYSADPQVFVDRALEVVARGYNAVKVLITPPTESPQPYRRIPVRRDNDGGAARGAGRGHGHHGRLPRPSFSRQAIEFCRVLAPYRPYFIEEPVPPENVDALVEVRRASPVPIATGERLVTRFEFREIFEKQACHIIQPDLCHCGGLWEAKKIAAMAETYFMGVAPHNPLGPVANAAALHFALSTPNFLIQEDMLSDVPWRWDVVSIVAQDRKWLLADDRHARLGHRGGRRSPQRSHPFQQEVIHPMTVHAHDGAVLDW